MSVLIGLVRHGAHDELGRVLSGRRDLIGLNAAGLMEVMALAEAITGRGIELLEASPRRRTIETADILGEAVRLKPVITPALDEIDFGDWNGKTFAELDGDPAWDRWNVARAAGRAPNGEAMTEAVCRVVAHLDRLAGRKQGPVLCVSHCDVIRGALAHYLGLSLDNILRFDIDTASVSWLKVDGHGAAQVVAINARS